MFCEQTPARFVKSDAPLAAFADTSKMPEYYYINPVVRMFMNICTSFVIGTMMLTGFTAICNGLLIAYEIVRSDRLYELMFVFISGMFIVYTGVFWMSRELARMRQHN